MTPIRSEKPSSQETIAEEQPSRLFTGLFHSFSRERVKKKGGTIRGTVYEQGPFTRDYWFPRCEGFRVDSLDGHVGYVEEVLFGSLPEEPEALAVRSSRRKGDRLLVVPVEAVAALDPQRELIRLERMRATAVTGPTKLAT